MLVKPQERDHFLYIGGDATGKGFGTVLKVSKILAKNKEGL